MTGFVPFTLSGNKFYLHYSMAVLFDVVEKFGGIQTALEAMETNDKAAFETVRWFAVRMANDAELCRRAMGYDKSKIISEDDLTALVSPFEFSQIYEAVVTAIEKGYARNAENDDEEVDLGLAELNEKKTGIGA